MSSAELSEFLSKLDTKLDCFKEEIRRETKEIVNQTASDILKADEAVNFSRIGRAQTGGNRSGPDLHSSTQSDSAVNIQTVDYQAEFAVIKDALARIKLPTDKKFCPNSAGLNREDRGAYSILRQCAQYVETSLKIAQLVKQGEYPVEEAIDDLIVTNTAQIKLLKEEHAALMVQGKFNKETASMFKALRKEGNSFSQEDLDTLQIAANLTSKNATRQEDTRGRFRGRFHGRGYGRGRFWRDNGQQSYSRFLNQDVPTANAAGDS